MTVNSVYNGFRPGGALGRIDYDAYDINFVGRQHNFANPKVTGSARSTSAGWCAPGARHVPDRHARLEHTFGINPAWAPT
jgi:hypothetical protein